MLRAIRFLKSVWNHSTVTDVPGSTSCTAPTLYITEYGRFRFGSNTDSARTPKFVGRFVKSISQPGVL